MGSAQREQSQRAIADYLAIAFCIAAILYVVSGFVSPAGPKPLVPRELTPAHLGGSPLSGPAFALNAVPNLGRPAYIKGALDLYGSFLDHGDSTGSAETAVYHAVPDFYMFVSGFPNRPGNKLLVEVTTEHSGTVRLQVAPFEDTGSKWLLKRISLRSIQGATGFRIVATDANKGPEGWLGFSTPFEDEQAHGRTGLLIVKQIAFSVLSIAAAFVALLGPGFLLRQLVLERRQILFSIVWVAVPGLIALALIGVFAWLGPRHIKPAVISRVLQLLFFAFATWRVLRARFSLIITNAERRLLLVVLVVALICAARSIYSLGPVGELYHGEVSRTLEVGGRSDSRLPYFVTQLAKFRQSTASPFARELYGTWTFSDRGQLVALAATPLVLAGPTYMPDNKPEEVWTVFDPEGFAAYRFSMIVFASCTLLFVFGVSALFLPDDWALFAVLVTAASPFFLHEVYFTWPKLEAAVFVLLSGYLVLKARFLLAGLALGLGYLCHPSALLSTPAILGLIVLLPSFTGAQTRVTPQTLYRWTLQCILVLAGLGVWIIFWRLVNGPAVTQAKFLDFVFASGNTSHTLAHWLAYRLDSLLNTFVPLNQFLLHAHDENVNAIERPSPAIVRFFVQPWSAVPFAVGVAYFFCLLRLFYLGFRKAWLWLTLLLVLPLLIFTIYMGVDSSGLLKDGMHAWFLTLLIASVVIWKKYGARSQAFWRICNWALLSRVLDILLMMLLPAIWTQHSLLRPPFVLSDLLALLAMLGGTLWLCVYTFRLGEELRNRAHQDQGL